MVTSRGAFFLGLSLIICVAMFIYGPQMGKFRYLTIPTNQGVFILDTKTQMMNVCTSKSCKVVPQAGGMIVPGGMPTYGQFGPAPVNSLGVVENGGMMPNCINCNIAGYGGGGYGYVPMQQQQVTANASNVAANTARVSNVEREMQQEMRNLRNDEAALGI